MQVVASASGIPEVSFESWEDSVHKCAVTIFTDERCLGYAAAGHPERPQRIAGILDRLRVQTEVGIDWEPVSEGSERAILRAHSDRHVAALRHPDDDFDADTPGYPDIWEHARRSVGGAIAAMELARQGTTSFSMLRPPGHHATRNHAMGFCYLNCIAIAALEALATGTRKIAIFDFDVHHGNGTEAILINVPNVAFFSVHQLPCYPGTGSQNVGENCFNFPVEPLTPREEYRHVLRSALDGVKAFQPALVGVSAGFDAYVRDPLAQETLELEDFHWIGQEVRKLQVPTFSIMEGGYSAELPDLVLAYLKGIEGG